MSPRHQLRKSIAPSAFAQLALPLLGRPGRGVPSVRGISVFSEGECVHWVSQSRGVVATRQGVVEAIVPAGQRPDVERFPDLRRAVAAGHGRAVPSYVVRVGERHFWPHARQLRRGPAQEVLFD